MDTAVHGEAGRCRDQLVSWDGRRIIPSTNTKYGYVIGEDRDPSSLQKHRKSQKYRDLKRGDGTLTGRREGQGHRVDSYGTHSSRHLIQPVLILD